MIETDVWRRIWNIETITGGEEMGEQKGNDKMTYDKISGTMRWNGSNITWDLDINVNIQKILGIRPM